MKKVFTIILSMAIFVAFAQERQNGGHKIINQRYIDQACPGLITTPVDGSVVTVNDLIDQIIGAGIAYSNVGFSGLQGTPLASAGLFTGGINAGLGIESGIILSSGYISNAIGPNTNTDITGVLNLPGDAALSTLAGFATLDATVLQFDFIPDFDEIFIQFVFGSDEYNEWVNSEFNDVFAFYLNGTNIALVPGTGSPITINTINNGANSGYYKDNTAPTWCTEMDGFTTVLVVSSPVVSGQTNTIRLAIADGSDDILDSWIFIKSEGFTGQDPDVPLSNWPIYLGIFLIAAFMVFLYRRRFA